MGLRRRQLVAPPCRRGLGSTRAIRQRLNAGSVALEEAGLAASFALLEASQWMGCRRTLLRLTGRLSSWSWFYREVTRWDDSDESFYRTETHLPL